MGGDEPEGPDYEKIMEMNEEAAELAYKTHTEQMAWAKEVRAKNDALVKQVLDVQLPIMQLQLEAGKKAQARYDEFYAPKEQEFAEKLWGWDTPERRAQKQAEATQDIRRQNDAARANAEAKLAGMGVDPSQIRSGALSRAIDVEAARSEAGASWAAREQVEQQGLGYQGQVVNLGKGVANQALGTQNAAVNTGNAAAGNQLNNAQVNSAIVGTPLQYFGQYNAALGNQNAGAAGFGNYVQGIGNGGANSWMGTAGALVGGAAGAYFGAGNPYAIQAGAMAGGMAGGYAGTAMG
jgi:hypothetical protein